MSFEYEERLDLTPFRSTDPALKSAPASGAPASSFAPTPKKISDVRTYDLIYLDQRPDLKQPSLPLNGVSLLSQVKVTGHDGDKTETLPPLEFRYTSFEPEATRFLPTPRVRPARPIARQPGPRTRGPLRQRAA